MSVAATESATCQLPSSGTVTRPPVLEAARTGSAHRVRTIRERIDSFSFHGHFLQRNTRLRSRCMDTEHSHVAGLDGGEKFSFLTAAASRLMDYVLPIVAVARNLDLIFKIGRAHV